jgi:hypothetical protein
MIESFERNLKLQKIKLQFEEAESEEDILALCKKFVDERTPKQVTNTKNTYSREYEQVWKDLNTGYPYTTNRIEEYSLRHGSDLTKTLHTKTKPSPLNLGVDSKIELYRLAGLTTAERDYVLDLERRNNEQRIFGALVDRGHIIHKIEQDVYRNFLTIRTKLEG